MKRRRYAVLDLDGDDHEGCDLFFQVIGIVRGIDFEVYHDPAAYLNRVRPTQPAAREVQDGFTLAAA